MGLTYKQDRESEQENQGPVLERDGHDIEEGVEHGNLHDEDLSHQRDGGDDDESLTPSEVESASSRLKCPGIEKIPEMGDDEDGEEQRELIWCDRPVFSHGKTEEIGHARDVGMMEHIPQPDEKEEEKESHSEDVASHVAVEDESPVVSGLVAHHLLCGRQSRECERCERVHDEVDPEHLRDGEGRLQAHERACEHEQACRNVDRELEE